MKCDNDFAVNDQVRSESFNVSHGHLSQGWQPLLLAIGNRSKTLWSWKERSIIISTSLIPVPLRQATLPAKGDVLNQCGNRTDVERQNCLIFSAVDTIRHPLASITASTAIPLPIGSMWNMV